MIGLSLVYSPMIIGLCEIYDRFVELILNCLVLRQGVMANKVARVKRYLEYTQLWIELQIWLILMGLMSKKDYDLNEITILSVALSYQDTDAGSVVYHGRYLDYGERARAKIFREFFGKIKAKDEQSFVVRNLSIEYVKSAGIDDIITVKTRIPIIKFASMGVEHDFFVNGGMIANMKVELVNIENGKPKKIGEKILGKLRLIRDMES